ncbi:MAG: hypothetical protein M3373_10145 [Gemmatimonadota bacterium]|nr:hypothetical protein [Gemmatimonadota bacterium]
MLHRQSAVDRHERVADARRLQRIQQRRVVEILPVELMHAADFVDGE